MAITQVSIVGYRISEELYNGSRTLVYRGNREIDSLPVVIKLLKNPYPSFSELLSFRNQYTISKNLNYPGIIQTYSLQSSQNGYALVMEDFGGISLKDYFTSNQTRYIASLEEFLEIAIPLCNTLDILYQERIIHKDIKPANILINPKSKEVKLIDFSIASLLPRETQILINPNVLEGTLAYISPEQTGRMNRGIDYRTDLYSLGITFYQLLTGKLPFASNDPLELIHSHIAKLPPPLFENREEIPQVISDIVMKLMAKNAEDRYQNALGLKFDLENCLQQLQSTGTIKEFEIAKRDVCDRFIISDKLYGRETEVSTLLKAFARVSLGATEMMLVAGFSGIGKTAVINEIHKPIVRQRGYFIKGKYDQFQRNIPFSAFVQAFRDLMGQLFSESDTEIQQWRKQILESLGENGQVIIEVIPELEKIIGEQPPAIKLSGAAAQNRFNLLFQKFTQVFTSSEQPLVIFLDDLQWADSASLKLIQLLMADTKYLLLIGAYRDNEVNLGHPLMLTLREMQKKQVTINTITLAPLSQVQVNQLVADTLKCTETLAWTLSELVSQKTQGNPFFATQFVKALHQEHLIKFDFDLGCWQCDMGQIISLAVTDDVIVFMAEQLRKLPQSTQDILQLAACIGSQFDLATLAIVSEKSSIETAADLWKALQEGLILPLSDIYKFYVGQENLARIPENQDTVTYKFLHDRVQQAAYSLIPDHQKQTTHYRIGQLLLQQISPQTIEERIFEIVNQLNYGTALITQQTERDKLAQLNLTACRKAKSATAYQAAREYANIGLSILGEKAWQDRYEMTLSFHNDAAELAMLCGDFEAMERLIETVITQTHYLQEKLNVYCVRIQSKTSQNKLTEAIALGLQILQQLGVTFPENPTQTDIQQSIQEISELIGDRKIADFVHLPMMTDTHKLAIIQMTNSITPAAYLSGSPLFLLLTSFSIKLSLQYGNLSSSGYNYICYSVIVGNLLQDVDLAVQFSELALNVVLKLDAKATKPEVLMIRAGFIQHRQVDIRETLLLLRESYVTALEVGNLLIAGHSGHFFCLHSFWCGQTLSSLEQDMRTYYNALVQVNQLSTANYCRIYWQSVLNLLGLAEHPTLLSGPVLQEMEFLPLLLSDNDLFGLYHFYLYKLTLCFLFGEVELANNYAVESRNYLMPAAGAVSEPAFYLYDSLIALALLSQQPVEISLALERVVQNQTQLKHWAHYAPMNHQHKFDLVEAEKCRVLAQKVEAIDFYDKAISGAKANEYIQEEALANELAAKFYLDWGKERIAGNYMIEAYYSYARWGAKAKVAELERRYPQLLVSILQQNRTAFSVNETVFALETVTSTSSSTSSSSVSDSLDLKAILKVSQTISGEIELEKLLSSLLSILIENAGADKCVLMLLRDEHLLIKGLITAGSEPVVFQHLPIDDSQDIPLKLIYKVKRDYLPVVLINASDDPNLANDPYIMRQQPKSILCSPILHQRKLLGILYLENNLATGVFTSDRVELLNLLSAQAAISLENAQFYEQSLKNAQQLERSLNELSVVQSRFYNLVDNVPGVVYQYCISADGTISLVYISGECYKLYEITPDQAMSNWQLLVEVIHPDDSASYQQSVTDSMQTLTPFEWSGRIITPSGIVKWIHGEARIEQRADGSLVWDGLILDISDRKRAEFALQISEQNLRTMLDNVTNAIIVHDLDGMILNVNDSTLKLYGLEPEQLTQISVLEDCSAPDNPFHLIPDFWGRVLAGEIVNFEWKGRRLTDGRIFDTDVRLNKIFLNGKAIIFANIQDISDRKQAEQELQNAQLQIIQSEKMSALGNLVAGVAHEMNNPLGFITASLKQAKPTFTDIIEHLKLYQESLPNKSEEILDHAEEIDLDYSLEDLPKMIDAMSIACDRLKNISTSLRTFSRADQDYKVPFNIHEGIDSTILILKHRLKANEQRPAIEVVTNYGKLPKIECFPGQLNQVFMNILANAIDALNESSQGRSFEDITVNPNRITITTFVSDNQVQIAIADNGIGMSESVKQKIFDHLFTTKAVGKGTGLGLAIARQIVVEKHNGSLNVNSTIGEGTEFVITLPSVRG